MRLATCNKSLLKPGSDRLASNEVQTIFSTKDTFWFWCTEPLEILVDTVAAVEKVALLRPIGAVVALCWQFDMERRNRSILDIQPVILVPVSLLNRCLASGPG